MANPPATRPPALRPPQIAARVLAAVLGGYAFTWGFTSFGVAALVGLGVDFHEAETGVLLVALPVYLAAFLWSFATPSLARVAAVLGGGAVLMLAAAWLLQGKLLA